MAIQAPYPELSELLVLMGEAARRMSEIEATEGAAGNISVYIGWPIDPRRIFPNVEPIVLPEPLPELAGCAFLVSGSGRRLREIIDDPAANLGCVVVDEGGATGMHYSVAAAALRAAHQRVQLAPGGPPRPDPPDRHQLPCGHPRPAAAPDLSEPHPALPG